MISCVGRILSGKKRYTEHTEAPRGYPQSARRKSKATLLLALCVLCGSFFSVCSALPLFHVDLLALLGQPTPGEQIERKGWRPVGHHVIGMKRID